MSDDPPITAALALLGATTPDTAIGEQLDDLAALVGRRRVETMPSELFREGYDVVADPPWGAPRTTAEIAADLDALAVQMREMTADPPTTILMGLSTYNALAADRADAVFYDRIHEHQRQAREATRTSIENLVREQTRLARDNGVERAGFGVPLLATGAERLQSVRHYTSAADVERDFGTRSDAHEAAAAAFRAGFADRVDDDVQLTAAQFRERVAALRMPFRDGCTGRMAIGSRHDRKRWRRAVDAHAAIAADAIEVGRRVAALEIMCEVVALETAIALTRTYPVLVWQTRLDGRMRHGAPPTQNIPRGSSMRQAAKAANFGTPYLFPLLPMQQINARCVVSPPSTPGVWAQMMGRLERRRVPTDHPLSYLAAWGRARR